MGPHGPQFFFQLSALVLFSAFGPRFFFRPWPPVLFSASFIFGQMFSRLPGKNTSTSDPTGGYCYLNGFTCSCSQNYDRITQATFSILDADPASVAILAQDWLKPRLQ